MNAGRAIGECPLRMTARSKDNCRRHRGAAMRLERGLASRPLYEPRHLSPTGAD
jgi:hypothetical protein